jgi:tRNA pseudouridine38-40 synthase
MLRSVLHIEYDGTTYAGYQLQPDQRTIQGELELALHKLYKQDIRVHGSGRTDAGVHAKHQIVHFDPPILLKNLNLKAALNTLLPKDIRVIQTAKADEVFHSRFSAKERQYRFIVSTQCTALDRYRVWQIYQDLDFRSMQESAAIFIGEHDFTSFCSAQAEVDHKRCIITRSEWIKENDQYVYYIYGNRFLHSMVRSLVGTMVEVGKGKISINELFALLEKQERNGEALTAPPQGLTLMNVIYEQEPIWENY